MNAARTGTCLHPTASTQSPEADLIWPVALSNEMAWLGSDALQGTANRHVHGAAVPPGGWDGGGLGVSGPAGRAKMSRVWNAIFQSKMSLPDPSDGTWRRQGRR